MMIRKISFLVVSAVLLLCVFGYASAENVEVSETEIETETEYVSQVVEVDEEEYPEILYNYTEPEESIELKAVFKTKEGDTLLYYRMTDDLPPKTWFFGNLESGDGIDFDGFTVEVIGISDDKLDYLFILDDLGE